DVLDLDGHQAELALGLLLEELAADLVDAALDALHGELELPVADGLADLRDLGGLLVAAPRVARARTRTGAGAARVTIAGAAAEGDGTSKKQGKKGCLAHVVSPFRSEESGVRRCRGPAGDAGR